jgi:hypothetical protein
MSEETPLEVRDLFLSGAYQPAVDSDYLQDNRFTTGRKLENPFRNRNKVTDPHEFHGRTKQIMEVLEEILYSEPQNVALIGERRIGKSSLLTHLFWQMTRKRKEFDQSGQTDKADKKVHYVCILLDPEELVIDDPYGLTWVVIDELIRSEPVLEDFIRDCPTVKFRKDKLPQRPEIILNNLLKEACQKGYRFVFFIDEFELLARNKKFQAVNYLHYMRGISDNYALAFVTASRKSLSEITVIPQAVRIRLSGSF